MTPMAMFALAGAVVLAQYGVRWWWVAAAFALALAAQAAPAFRGLQLRRMPAPPPDAETEPLPPGYGGQPVFPIRRDHQEPK